MALEDKDYIKRQTELAAKGLKKFIDGDAFEQLFVKENSDNKAADNNDNIKLNESE